MTTTTTLLDRFNNRRVEVLVHDDEVMQYEGRLAVTLVEKWGLVLAAPDGEDSSGRQRLAPMSPKDIVDKACTVAALMAAELRSRRWLVPGVSIDDILSRDDKPERSK